MPHTMEPNAPGVDSIYPFVHERDVVQMGETSGFARQGSVLEIVAGDINATTK
jgi:hypothetical protein